MAQNYNPRFASSASRSGKRPRPQRNAPGARRQQPERPARSVNRTKVDYRQSAKDDLSTPTPQKDPRMRYAHYRADRTVRVLDELEEARFKDKHQINDLSADTGPLSSGRVGTRGGRRAITGGPADAEGAAIEPMTIGEHRRMRRAAARRASKVPGRMLIVALILLVCVGVAVGIYQSPLFAIREVRVEGAQRLTGERLTELAAVAEGSTLLRVDVEGIRKRVAADPWIASVEVRRSFPATVVLVVEERQVAAVVAVPSLKEGVAGQNWLLSADGVWLASYTASASLGSATTEGMGEGEGTAGGADAGAQTGTSGAGGTDAGAGTTGTGGGATEGTGTGEGEGEGSADTSAGAGSGGDEGALVEAGSDTDVVQAVTVPSDEETPQGITDPATPTSAPGDSSMFEGVRVTAAELEQIPLVKDISRSVSPEVGVAATDEGVLNALAVINGFTPEMLSLVRSISAPDRVKTTLDLTNNVGVAFGAAEDVEAKEQVILGLLAEHEGKIAYINVRVADRATYRATA